MRDRRSINNLGELVKTAINLDDRLYERSLERRYDSKVSRKAGYMPNKLRNRQSRLFYKKQQRNPNAIDQQFNAIQKGRLKGKGNRGKSLPRKGVGKLTYYAYSKESYIVRDCRSKNIV